ncbi:hypothetical protein Nepgr_030258 [Nepenthes gracilis]|uniref:C2 domain-containing protein n=1 Tax=Nepenthes gracilis TaxID=150966 RepID=A0AAD3TE90_NEPGR|nr:hypothetical protein Nepgr_030258 [Nepenthes gracilis]
MAYRTLEVTVLSANDLKKAGLFSKMDLYVVVFLHGASTAAKHKTPIDRHGGRNPTWNSSVKFTIDELAAKQGRLTLVFHILRRKALGDKLVGEVNAPVKDLLSDDDAATTASGVGKSVQFVSYQVRKPSGMPRGVLNFSYKFGDTANQSYEPATAFPAAAGSSTAYPPSAPTAPPAYVVPEQYPPPSSPLVEDYNYGAYPSAGAAVGYGYPAQYYGYPSQSGYGYPAQPGYGYPAQSGYGYNGYGYGYPPVVQPKAKKNNFGMGVGAGLLGGALAGLLVGDLVSDVGFGMGGF